MLFQVEWSHFGFRCKLSIPGPQLYCQSHLISTLCFSRPRVLSNDVDTNGFAVGLSHNWWVSMSGTDVSMIVSIRFIGGLTTAITTRYLLLWYRERKKDHRLHSDLNEHGRCYICGSGFIGAQLGRVATLAISWIGGFSVGHIIINRTLAIVWMVLLVWFRLFQGLHPFLGTTAQLHLVRT